MKEHPKVLAVLVSFVIGLTLQAVPVVNAALPSPFELELKQATKIQIGKATSIALPDCKIVIVKKKYTTKCTYGKFIVTVNSFKFDRVDTPIDIPVSIYAIDLKMENYSKTRDSGLEVGALLRCKQTKNSSSFYSDSIDPQDVPAGSELSGVVYSSFPDDLSPEMCQMPTLWISLISGADLKDKELMADMKKKKLIARAYIPLTAEMLRGA